MESVISASIIVLVIRTRKPLFKSKPRKHLLIATLSIVGATAIIPFTPVAEVFGFTGLTPLYLLAMGVIVLLYSLAAEVVKKIFYKRVKL
jgi:P-type Mg2+ transporter